MQIKYLNAQVQLPSKFTDNRPMDDQVFWTVPVHINWQVVGDNPQSYQNGILDIKVFSPRSTSLEDVQTKAGELVKKTLSPDAELVIGFA